MDIIIFTDGSCIKKYDKCYAGYGVHFPNGEFDDISKPFVKTPITNQRAELYAIYSALKKVTKNYDLGSDKLVNNVMIYTDSEYSIKSLTEWIKSWIKNDWKTSNKKPVKNMDLIVPIYNIIKKFPNKIFLFHVRAHTKNSDYFSVHNDIADKLANNGSSKSINFFERLRSNKLKML